MWGHVPCRTTTPHHYCTMPPTSIHTSLVAWCPCEAKVVSVWLLCVSSATCRLVSFGLRAIAVCTLALHVCSATGMRWRRVTRMRMRSCSKVFHTHLHACTPHTPPMRSCSKVFHTHLHAFSKVFILVAEACSSVQRVCARPFVPHTPNSHPLRGHGMIW